MKNFCLYLLILICAGLLPAKAVSQSTVKITGDFSNLSFKQFVTKIESAYPYRFYFDSSETDSIHINVQASGLTIQQLLEKIFAGSIFHFAVDDANRIFITRRFAIQTSLPPDFFTRKKNPDTAAAKNALPVFEETEDKKENLPAAIENKLFQLGTKASGTPGNATIAGCFEQFTGQFGRQRIPVRIGAAA